MWEGSLPACMALGRRRKSKHPGRGGTDAGPDWPWRQWRQKQWYRLVPPELFKGRGGRRVGGCEGPGLGSGSHRGACTPWLLALSNFRKAGRPGWAGVRGLRAGQVSPDVRLAVWEGAQLQEAGIRPPGLNIASETDVSGRGPGRGSTLASQVILDKSLNHPKPQLAHLSSGPRPSSQLAGWLQAWKSHSSGAGTTGNLLDAGQVLFPHLLHIQPREVPGHTGAGDA